MQHPPPSQFEEDMSREQKAEDTLKEEEDCPDEDEDCREMVSPCCDDQMQIIFGSLPVKAKCQKCGEEHLLRELVSSI
jgi:hypothetical protein